MPRDLDSGSSSKTDSVTDSVSASGSNSGDSGVGIIYIPGQQQQRQHLHEPTSRPPTR
ncbi:GD24256 [Drosophila simulans]|uniref:GD24256 n=1 Tax=Drosophila simulans TaxID=7240 RepID=B4Q3D2_DROSI|nr:GD24256 [Drosophila simulans]